jgi:hypothetical protein
MSRIMHVLNVETKTGEPAKLNSQQQSAVRCFALLMCVAQTTKSLRSKTLAGDKDGAYGEYHSLLDSLMECGGTLIEQDTLALAALVGCQLSVTTYQADGEVH